MNFTKLNNNGLVDGFGILTKCEKKTSSRGGAYLDMILSDNDDIRVISKYYPHSFF